MSHVVKKKLNVDTACKCVLQHEVNRVITCYLSTVSCTIKAADKILQLCTQQMQTQILIMFYSIDN